MLQNSSTQHHGRLSPELQQTVANLALEGVSLSQNSIDDLKLAETGQLTKQEFVNRLLARAQ